MRWYGKGNFYGIGEEACYRDEGYITGRNADPGLCN